MSYQSVFRPGRFAGQAILVTGGGSGLGRCMAHELASLGASIALVGRKADKLEKDLGGVHEKLAELEDRFSDTALYEAAHKDELRELLARQAELKVREGELEEAWLEALETLESLQAQLEASA